MLRKEDNGGVGSTVYGNSRRRFLQESELGAMPGSHPYIIQVMGFDEVEDLMVLALEYAEGGSLADKLEQGRQKDSPMEIGDAVRITAEVANGLAGLLADATSVGNAILVICTAAWALCVVFLFLAILFIPKDIQALHRQLEERAQEARAAE